MEKNKEPKFEELNEKEKKLILWMRTKQRYGELTIQVRDGIPQMIKEIIKKEML